MVMKYQAQVRTILQSGQWSEWTNVGDPMDDKDKLDFLELQAQCPKIPAEFRFIEVGNWWPRVFAFKSVIH